MIDYCKAEESRIEEIMALEKECFSPPWTEGTVLSELYNSDTFFTVASEEDIVGFIIMRRLGDEAEVFQIAVTEARRRAGIGSALLGKALKDADERGIQSVYLEVRAGNPAAMRLYEKHGFRKAGTRKNYYEAPRENAVVMKRGRCWQK